MLLIKPPNSGFFVYMITGFWKKLPRPFFALAPMSNVTDATFRQILVECGKPDVMWTEFVSADGLTSAGKENLLIDLKFSKNERPIVAQIFGSKPKKIYEAARMAVDLGYDGIDINMGCPDRNVQKQGAGSQLILQPKLAQEIIEAAKLAAEKIPVSVKTRIGYNQNEIETWLPIILEMDVAAIAIHGRTKKQMYTGAADWKVIARAVEIRNKYDSSGSKTLIIGSGDITSYTDGLKRAAESGVDGVMIGRATLGNPWVFNKNVNYEKISIADKLGMLVKHAQLFEKTLLEHKGFDHTKKHFRGYVNGFDGAKELRVELMGAKSAKDIEKIVKNFLAVR